METPQSKALNKSVRRHKFKEIDKKVKGSMIKGPEPHKSTGAGERLIKFASKLK